MDGSLTGQVALVTGGAGLLGSAISRRLAAEGAAVVINGRDAGKAENLAVELTTAGQRAAVRIASVRDERDVAAMMTWIITEFGRIDIVVNNAGGVGVAGAGMPAYVVDMSLSDWQHVLDLNLTGAFLCTRAALPFMIQQRYGRFVNISSAGYFGAMGLAGYAAAKAGLIAFSRTIALENAQYGITANVVAPHLVESPRRDPRPTPQSEALLNQAPIRRYGKPEEIAGAVRYFVSDDAAYITGETLHVMGGMQWLGPTIDLPGFRRG